MISNDKVVRFGEFDKWCWYLQLNHCVSFCSVYSMFASEGLMDISGKTVCRIKNLNTRYEVKLSILHTGTAFQLKTSNFLLIDLVSLFGSTPWEFQKMCF